MTPVQFNLAKFNRACAVGPRDDPRMAGFVAAFPRLKRLAAQSPGFVWQLQRSRR